MDGREWVWAVPFGLRFGFVLTLIAPGLRLQFLPVGVVFRGAWPRGRILRKSARPMWHQIPYDAAGTRAKNRARDDEQDDKTGHRGQITQE